MESRLFEATEELDHGILTSQVLVSAATAMDVLGPLDHASDRVQNAVTVFHISEEGEITRVKLTLCGKDWSRKFDARRIFVNAPRESKMVLKNLDVAGMTFPDGEKHSLWVPSNQFDWQINKSNNKEQGTYTQEELKGFGITEWCLRVHILVNKTPTFATARWVAIPSPVEDLARLPGDARKPGYPTISISDAEMNMAGVPSPTRADGLIMYPSLINDGPPNSAICLPTNAEIIKTMRSFWGRGSVVRGLNAKDWHEATKGPDEPNSDRGLPAWAWPPQEAAQVHSEDSASEPSEGSKFSKQL